MRASLRHFELHERASTGFAQLGSYPGASHGPIVINSLVGACTIISFLVVAQLVRNIWLSVSTDDMERCLLKVSGCVNSIEDQGTTKVSTDSIFSTCAMYIYPRTKV